MKYFLDTSVIIDYLKNKEEIVAFVNQLDGELTSSYICLAEFYDGVHQATRNQTQIKKSVESFFLGLDEVYTIDKPIAQEFGRIRAQLKQKGEVIEDLDIFIAATCTINHLILITHNQNHFKRVPHLLLKDFSQ